MVQKSDKFQFQIDVHRTGARRNSIENSIFCGNKYLEVRQLWFPDC